MQSEADVRHRTARIEGLARAAASGRAFDCWMQWIEELRILDRVLEDEGRAGYQTPTERIPFPGGLGVAS